MAEIKTRREKYQQRWTQLKNERSTWLPHYRTISEYLLPRNGRFVTTDRNRGSEDRFNTIVDSTGTKALHTLGAGLMAGMTSPARPWFRLATSDPDMMEYEPVKLWLGDVTRVMREIFHRSNTYRSLHTVYEELGAFGTAASIILPDYDNVIHHHPLTAGEYAISTDSKGRVVTLAREFEMTVSQMVREFGLENCSRTVRKAYETGNLDQWVPICHLIEPRYDRDPKAKDAKNMPWMSCYFELGNDSERKDDQMLREGGFKRFPAICPRWMVIGGDIYGASPAMEALGDIKQLQHQQTRKAEGIDYQTRPPLQVPSSMRNMEIDSLPGGIMYYDGASPTGGIRSAFEVNLNLQHLLLDIQDVRERIRGNFFADLFMMLANDDRSGITAREVAERHEEKLLMLGPVLERLHDEMLNPMIDITFDRMADAGILPPPPKELEGQDLNVEFVSMLAQAQRAVGISGVERLTMYVGQLAAAKQSMDVWDKLDTDQMIDGYADMSGVDPKFIVSDDKVSQMRDMRAQEMQKQQAMAQAEQMASTASKLGGIPTDTGTLASDLTRQFTQL